MKKILVIILILILMGLVSCNKENSKSNIDDSYGFYGVEVNEENKLLGDIILSLYPEDERSHNVPVVSDKQKDNSFILNLFNLKQEILESYAISTSKDNSKIDTIVIIAPHIGYEVDVLMGMEKRLFDLIENYSKEEQESIIKNTILEQYENTKYIILVISDNSEIIFNEITKGLKAWDASVVSVVDEIKE